MKIKKVFYILLLIIIIILISILLFKLSSKGNNSGGKNSNSLNSSNNTVQNLTEAENSSAIQITESYFMSKINDVYINYKEYIGKEIDYEGFVYFPEDHNYSMVVGRNYYCCGTDSFVVGFECDTDKQFKENAWVKVRGTVEINDDNSSDIYPYLKIISIEEMQQRGKDTVNS